MARTRTAPSPGPGCHGMRLRRAEGTPAILRAGRASGRPRPPSPRLALRSTRVLRRPRSPRGPRPRMAGTATGNASRPASAAAGVRPSSPLRGPRAREAGRALQADADDGAGRNRSGRAPVPCWQTCRVCCQIRRRSFRHSGPSGGEGVRTRAERTRARGSLAAPGCRQHPAVFDGRGATSPSSTSPTPSPS